MKTPEKRVAAPKAKATPTAITVTRGIGKGAAVVGIAATVTLLVAGTSVEASLALTVVAAVGTAAAVTSLVAAGINAVYACGSMGARSSACAGAMAKLTLNNVLSIGGQLGGQVSDAFKWLKVGLSIVTTLLAGAEPPMQVAPGPFGRGASVV